MKELITLENSDISLSFTKKEGRLVSLYWKAAEKEFLDCTRMPRAPFIVWTDFAKPFRFLDNTVPGEPGAFANERLLPRNAEFFPFENGLEIRYKLNASLNAVIRIVLDGAVSRWSFTLKNEGVIPADVLPVFPVIDCVSLGKNARVLAMNQAGAPEKLWKVEGGAYGNGGRHSAQVGCLFEDDACLGFYFEDKTFGPKDIRYKKPAVEVRRFPEKTLEPGGSLVIEDTVIMLYKGTWHTVAKAYAGWMRKSFDLPAAPAWLGEIQSFAGAWFEKKGKPNWEGPNLSEPLESFAELDRHFSGEHPELAEYAFFSELSAKDYGDKMYIYGSNRRHTDGFNIVRKDLGGAQGLKEGVEKVHKMGKRVTLYVEGLIVPGESDLFAEKPEAHDWLTMNPEGESEGSYTGQNFVHMCCGSAGWQDHLAEMCARLMRETGVDGIRLDSFSYYFWPCYNPAHNHASPFDCNKWMQDLLAKVSKAVLAVKPDALLATEAPVDYNRLWFNTALDSNFNEGSIEYELADTSVFRVMFPEFYMPRINGGQVMESLMLMPDGCSVFAGGKNPLFEKWHKVLPEFNDVFVHGTVSETKPKASSPDMILNSAYTDERMLVIGARSSYTAREKKARTIGLKKDRIETEVTVQTGFKPGKFVLYDIENETACEPGYGFKDGNLIFKTNSNWFAALFIK